MRLLALLLLAACSQTMAADDVAGGCEVDSADACRAAPGCHASYEEPGLSPPGDTYIGCAALVEVIALPMGVCSTLAEHDCGARNDCVTWYRPGPADGPEFERCEAE